MSHGPRYRIFLVMMPFRDVAPDLGVLLRSLADLEPHLPAVEGYYAGASDTALVGLQLRRRLVDRIGPGWLIALVAECGLPILTPDEYEPAMREAFDGQHLPGYEYHVRVDRAAAPAGARLIEHVVDVLKQRLEGSGAVVTPRVPHLPAFSRPQPLARAPRGTDRRARARQRARAHHHRIEPPASAARFEFSDFLESSSIFDASELGGPGARLRVATEAGRPSSEWELIL